MYSKNQKGSGTTRKQRGSESSEEVSNREVSNSVPVNRVLRMILMRGKKLKKKKGKVYSVSELLRP